MGTTKTRTFCWIHVNFYKLFNPSWLSSSSSTHETFNIRLCLICQKHPLITVGLLVILIQRKRIMLTLIKNISGCHFWILHKFGWMLSGSEAGQYHWKASSKFQISNLFSQNLQTMFYLWTLPAKYSMNTIPSGFLGALFIARVLCHCTLPFCYFWLLRSKAPCH